MRLQILSDVHLEFAPLDLGPLNSDVVIAAGDIGIGLEGVEWLAGLDRPVIYVAGNHEYWGHDLAQLPTMLLHRARRSNVHFLENREVEIDGVRFLGCTLWTDFGQGDASIKRQVQDIMNDFRRIACRERALSVDDLFDLNRVSREWLEIGLSRSHAGKTVVVTHHAPSMRSCYDSRDSVRRFAYCNAMEDLLSRHDVDLWVHGHIHCALEYRVGATRIVCNPRGYAPYHEVSDFNPGKIIVL